MIDYTYMVGCGGPDCDFAKREAAKATVEIIELLQKKFRVLETSLIWKDKCDSFIEERLALLKAIEDIFIKQACEDF